MHTQAAVGCSACPSVRRPAATSNHEAANALPILHGPTNLTSPNTSLPTSLPFCLHLPVCRALYQCILTSSPKRSTPFQRAHAAPSKTLIEGVETCIFWCLPEGHRFGTTRYVS